MAAYIHDPRAGTFVRLATLNSLSVPAFCVAKMSWFYAANYNLGDPFSGSNYTLNTFEYEREVIQDLAVLYKLDPKQAWGYVTNGGSEGNFKGLSLGLEKFPDAVIYLWSGVKTPTNSNRELAGHKRSDRRERA